jgi:hypothetical protein
MYHFVVLSHIFKGIKYEKYKIFQTINNVNLVGFAIKNIFKLEFHDTSFY